MKLLRRVWTDIRAAGWRLVNLDCVVSCEKPKILSRREEIRAGLARVLETEPDAVFVKGKTGEGMGPVGKGRAVEALAVCLLEKA
jgi:2-C-methyl-D-erythritol 2,4-cyclodiphosphate synthase/2-C-methyl-D-erythritol 4-phosphate cytidylyltransferase/2-C-methyl-D-erythritol 2,4-cyclodiphosphate synthase